ncbi:MAG: diphthine synthase [Nanoarchaeota archaeon]|nr:diphthine synthase [Nanoarchaeota archaeon]
MLYLIGLGLDFDSISERGKIAAVKCGKVYLENYTVDFPYPLKKIEDLLKKEICSADREFVESLKIVDESRRKDVALLVYGSPLTATTHISIVQECIKKKVKFEIIFGASVLDAVAQTGLQLYKFGKISSIPGWSKNFRPTSFAETIKQNLSIGAHTLLLADIGLEFNDALYELKESAEVHKIDIPELIICSRLGTKDSKILFDKTENLREKNIRAPFCIIIPGKMHFAEKEMAEKYSINKF